ncbi:hypothetical protein [Paraburkholderia sp. J12]|uniref:hypothetical protein n=1 Tax=Paraburkholderia sp. J12 TaxID=2805432 RepID=UPI002ABE2652|nr:hypothetical protein [Paraburkholderia sp. J12]
MTKDKVRELLDLAGAESSARAEAKNLQAEAERLTSLANSALERATAYELERAKLLNSSFIGMTVAQLVKAIVEVGYLS